jgi:hypothetical protein
MDYQEYQVRIYENGDKFYCQDGKLHRLDGPAFIRSNGEKRYWIEGEEYTESKFSEKIQNLNCSID